jgi:hypothetical protein
MNADTVSLEHFKFAVAFDGDMDYELQHDKYLFIQPHLHREPLLPCYFGYYYEDSFIIKFINAADKQQTVTLGDLPALRIVKSQNNIVREVTITPDFNFPGMYQQIVETRNGRPYFEAKVTATTVINGLGIATAGAWTMYRYSEPGTVFSSLSFSADQVSAGIGDFRLREYRARSGRGMSVVNDTTGGRAQFRDMRRASITQQSKPPLLECVVTLIGILLVVLGRQWRPRSTTLVGWFAIALLTFSCSESASPGPLRALPQPIKLGVAGQQEQRSFTFSIVNHGREEFCLARIRKTCGCVMLSEPPKTLLPDQSVSVTGALDTGKNLGAFRQTIYFTYTSKDGVELELPIVAEIDIRPLTSVNPPICSATCLQGETTERRLLIKGDGVITSVRSRDVGNTEHGSHIECKSALPLQLTARGTELALSFRSEECGLFGNTLELAIAGSMQLNYRLETSLMVRPCIISNPAAATVKGSEWAELRLSVDESMTGLDIRQVAISAPQCIEYQMVASDCRCGILRFHHVEQEHVKEMAATRSSLHALRLTYRDNLTSSIPILVR